MLLISYTKAWKNHKAIELYMFEFTKPSRGYTSFFNLDASMRLTGDHSPQFSLWLSVLWFKLIEFSFYDTRHEDARGETA